MVWLPDGIDIFICFDRMYERDRRKDRKKNNA